MSVISVIIRMHFPGFTSAVCATFNLGTVSVF